jgi:hypothetical protein
VYCSLWIHSSGLKSQRISLCGNIEAITWSCVEYCHNCPTVWFLRSDNALLHKTFFVKHFLATKLLWSTHPVPLICLRLISEYYQI